MVKSESIKELATALARAQGNIGAALKDAANPFFKTKYADLASVTEAIKPHLSANGLSYVQVSHDQESGVGIETIIMHASGEWISCGTVSVPVSKADAQGFGSAITYARRYSLSAAFGVIADDDDGNAAAKAKPEPKGHITPNSGIAEQFTLEQKELLHSYADDLRSRFNGVPENVGAGDAAKVWQTLEGTTEEKTYIWSLLDSKQRSAIKKAMGK